MRPLFVAVNDLVYLSQLCCILHSAVISECYFLSYRILDNNEINSCAHDWLNAITIVKCVMHTLVCNETNHVTGFAQTDWLKIT